MAMSDSIRRRIGALEDELAWADNLARAFAALNVDASNPIAAQFEHTIDALNRRSASLISALHWEHRS